MNTIINYPIRHKKLCGGSGEPLIMSDFKFICPACTNEVAIKLDQEVVSKRHYPNGKAITFKKNNSLDNYKNLNAFIDRYNGVQSWKLLNVSNVQNLQAMKI